MALLTKTVKCLNAVKCRTLISQIGCNWGQWLPFCTPTGRRTYPAGLGSVRHVFPENKNPMELFAIPRGWKDKIELTAAKKARM